MRLSCSFPSGLTVVYTTVYDYHYAAAAAALDTEVCAVLCVTHQLRSIELDGRFREEPQNGRFYHSVGIYPEG